MSCHGTDARNAIDDAGWRKSSITHKVSFGLMVSTGL
jgi:hypothetical protein